MRYLVHKPDGRTLQAPDAQRAADLAQPGDVEEDTRPGNPWPFIGWRADSLGVTGTPFATLAEARRHAA